MTVELDLSPLRGQVRMLPLRLIPKQWQLKRGYSSSSTGMITAATQQNCWNLSAIKHRSGRRVTPTVLIAIAARACFYHPGEFIQLNHLPPPGFCSYCRHIVKTQSARIIYFTIATISLIQCQGNKASV